MASSKANQKLTPAVVGYAHLPGENHGPVHFQRSWRLPINAAIVVLLLSCIFANSVCGDEKTDSARRYYRQGRESYSKGQYQKAIGYYEKALAILLEAFGEKHPVVAATYNRMGMTWQSMGQYHKAFGYFEQALAIFRGALPKGHPNI